MSAIEAGPGCWGLAWSDNLVDWERDAPSPLMRPAEPPAWDSGGLYKAFAFRHAEQWWCFYNARDRDAEPWQERTGLCFSDDLVHWRRHPANPVLDVGPPGSWDCRFASDPQVLQINGRWHMFYYGFDGHHAGDGVAYSDDLLTWHKEPRNPILTPGPAGSYDELHAHKPMVLYQDGVWYHFYTCVGAAGRGIALATSRPL